ncbi:UNVERIFIED_CONTAM: Retrovirus-related Pol polyprotein from transposon RE2 [Sesamum calycinum]|uniref:Retrovirus-related Pol polyprotein from transposon RE2 n=1 Tax=Sesamum calycinum TaxID=2727403 RepID=A0AAW2KHC9_9LAMI
MSYKYLRVWGSLTYVKRVVGDKLDSRSSLCRFIGYLIETEGYYFYDPSEQKIFVYKNAVFLEKGFPVDYRRDEVLLEESSEPTQQTTRHHLNLRFPLMVFQSSIDQSENLNHLRDPPKGVNHVRCKWVYKRNLGTDGKVTTFKTRLMAKGYTERPRVDFKKTYSPVAIAKSIRILLAIAACRRVSLLLEKSRRSVISKGPSMASNKLPGAGTHVLMKS